MDKKKSEGQIRADKILARADEILRESGDDFWLRNCVFSIIEYICEVKFDFNRVRAENEAVEKLKKEKEKLEKETEKLKREKNKKKSIFNFFK